jgi:thymidylate kinase
VAERQPKGRLVAIEGSDSVLTAEFSTRLHESLTQRGLSVLVTRWDASALFSDFVAAPVEERDLSPRTLMLLYAADLAFRLRWEIQPALEDGHVVLATPYVATGIAFGVATGLSQDWLQALFRFTPAAARTVVLREDAPVSGWKRRPERGFGEACTTLLEATPEGFARRKTRTAMVAALATAAEAHGGLCRKRDCRALVDEIVTLQSRPAGSARRRRAVR